MSLNILFDFIFKKTMAATGIIPKEVIQQDFVRRPYLIQRLKIPHQKKDAVGGIFGIRNPFAFGGGLKNGGLSDEIMNLLDEIWRYDYMGSAEFEYGALPESLEYIAEHKKHYIKGSVDINVTGRIDFDSKDKITKESKVFFVTEDKHSDATKRWIETFAKEESYGKTKEYVGLHLNIIGKEYHQDTVGWHDINNHYLFFTNETMFNEFCKLLGIK